MREREIFLQALDIQDRAERATFLDEACREQPHLRTAVEELFRAHEQAGTFLNQPHPAAGSPEETKDLDAHPGQLISGKYKLLQQIGEGAMGSVWMADQIEPVKRRVALKLIGSDRGNSRLILSRFEAERQAIALMDHPHIAKLLDAGTTEGERGGCPFFVMELVKGVPLTDFCDEHKLTIHERLMLFMEICGAIQHAHQKGIIHRDLKPTNILVELHDDKPVPKVIDFGLAKALSGQPLTEHTLFTAFGTVAGTPLYMAPEQAKFNAIDIDTRADIYALGVILYELLTGSTPIERATFKQAAFDEFLRLVRESEPPTPSKRLSTTQSKPSIAANRHSEPQKLGRFVKGELDWIVMKALAKERDRRYETANGFARDIERFLNHEPVLAGPPSASYQLRKFVRRNRGQVIAAALVVLALVAGIAGTTVGLIRAEQQRRIAVANELKATEAAEAERRAREREAAQRTQAERARDRTREALDAMTSTMTGDSLATQTEISADQKRFLTEVLKYYQQFAGENADDEKSRARTAAAAIRVGGIESRLGRKEQALAAFQMARHGYATLTTDFAAAREYRNELARSHIKLGLVLSDLGKRAEAEDEFRQAVAIDEKLAADFPGMPDYRDLLAASHNNLGIVLNSLGKRSEAEQEYRRALDMREKLAADLPKSPVNRSALAWCHNNLGVLLYDQGKHSEAEAEYRHALPIWEKLSADFPANPSYRRGLAATHNSLAIVLNDLGKRSEAEGEIRQVLAIREKLATDFPTVPEYRTDLATIRYNAGLLLRDLGRRTEAQEQYRQALSIQQKLVADFPAVPSHRRALAASHNDLGILFLDLSKPSEAKEQFRSALAIREKLSAEFPKVPEHRIDLALCHINLGSICNQAGDAQGAEGHYRKALAIEEKLVSDFPTVPYYRSTVANARFDLALLFWRFGKRSEAGEQYRAAIGIQEKLATEFPKVPEYQSTLAHSYANYALVLSGLRRRLESEEVYRKAIAIEEKLAADFPTVPKYRSVLAGHYTSLGILFKEWGKQTESDEHNRKALAILEKLVAEFPDVPVYRYELATSRVSLAIARINAGQVSEAVAEIAELARSSDWHWENWYNFACVYAVAATKSAQKKQEYGDRAMELLDKAVNAGFKDAAGMRQDNDLSSLRDRDDFKKLIAELTNGKQAAKKP